MTHTNYFKAHISGFNYQGYGVVLLQMWWDKLKADKDLSGKTLKVWEAVKVNETAGVVTATYNAAPIKTITL